MKQLVKKVFVAALALTVMFTMLAPATAEAAVTYNKSQTLYRTSKSGTSYTSIYISNLTKSQTIKKTSVKSDKTSVAKPWYLSRSISSYKTEYFSSNMTGDSNNYYSYDIGLELKKAGKAKISFKIGSKTYTSTVTVKNYTNPLSSVTITGVNGGKNIASKLSSSSSCSTLKLTKTTRNAVVKVKPKSGWKVTSISVENSQTGDTMSVSNYNYFGPTKGISNASLKLGTLTKNKKVTLRINCVDKTGASMNVAYYINN